MVEALHTAGARALSNRASATEPRQQSSTATACRVSPMELPLGGPALRHYTQSRPRPHRQKLNYRPSRPQETIIESENEVLELMGRVDEGVEEFFTKRVLPTDTLDKEDEESITVHEVAPASSVPCPPPTKTLRRKLGDFFTLKKRRGLKSEPSQEGRPKKASIADLIRPLREAARSEKDKEKDRVKEHDRENEKERAKDHPSAVTGESAVPEKPVTGDAPLRGEAVPPRRALREGKSQSLILLSGSAAAGPTNTRNTAKKQFEGQHSFEQKLHLMLQRIGVSKPQPGDTENQEGEMKKAESEGTIIDSKPEPPPTFSKPRTMSASSDTRHQIRASVSAHEAAGKPALLPKPVIKPAPPPTTSGRNTPENELTQIKEMEARTSTKLSPAAAPPAPAALTIADSVPDSASVTVSSSSAVTPADTDICTDSVQPTAAATTPTSSAVVPDSKASVSKTSAPTTEISTPFHPGAATPTEHPDTVSVPSTSSESITPSPCVTSASETITTPSITTPETVSAPSIQGSVSPASADLSTRSAVVDPKGDPSVDAFPAAGGDADTPVTTANSLPSTRLSDMPSGLSADVRPVYEAGREPTSVTGSSSETRVSSVPETTSPPPNSSIRVTAAVPHSNSINTPSTIAATSLPSTTTTTISSTTTESIIQISSSDTSSVSTPAIFQSATFSPTESPAPPTSSSETNPTDTCSTASSLKRADTTSTSSSAHSAGPDPSFSSNVSSTIAPPVAILPPADNLSATHQLSSPAPSIDSPGQDFVSQEEGALVEKIEKPITDKVTGEELGVVQKSKPAESEEKREVIESGTRRESDSDKLMLDNSDVIREEVKADSVKVEEGTLGEPAVGGLEQSDRSRDEAVTKAQKQDDAAPVSEK
ncbi:unnamed protein product [Menidia menidia]|uniref:(Atlantic silverside) hypothetical protein n=1 Tax=Menidia menidia TaxID=238744 RepID=A0A8S4ACD9_9TELE|nr:unnamed protein product [Menidia menidia]